MEFKLGNKPVAFQLTVHISNMVSYWNADNRSGRHKDDIGSYTEDEVLKAIDYFANAKHYRGIYKRSRSPLEFRCQQIVDIYGKNVILNYLNEVYHAVG